MGTLRSSGRERSTRTHTRSKHTRMSAKVVSNKAVLSAATGVRRAAVAKRASALSTGANRSNLRLTSKETARSGIDTDEILTTVTEKWESVENKPQAILYAGGAVVALVLVNSVVGAVNSLPLFPKVFKLVGLGYTAWFTYKYLLFKSSRAELATDIEELKAKISGGE